MSEPYVFVSYSRRQFYAAQQIAASLSANGAPTWLDVQEIPPGADWQAAIDQGIANCAAFILVASRSAYRSAPVQHEIAAAQAAGKPVYLAVIQHCPLVKQLQGQASIVDCRSQFDARIAVLADAIRTGKKHHDAIQRRSSGGFDGSIPFGKAKYVQLLLVALSYTIGTIALLINKQVVVHQVLPQQLIPALILIAAPISAWLICLIYSWYLAFAFLAQRSVSFATLEVWPTLNLVLIPTLYVALDFGSLIRVQGTFLHNYFTIDERFAATSLIFSALVLIPYGFILLSEMRRFLILFFSSLAFLLMAVLSFNLYLKLTILGALSCVVLVTLLWAYIRGRAVQDAFDGANFLPASIRGFMVTFGIAAFILAPVWFLPIYITFRVLIIIVIPVIAFRQYMLGRFPFRGWRKNIAPARTDQQWAKWLVPGALDLDQIHSIGAASWQRVTASAVPIPATWNVLATASDAAVADEIRQAFARYPALREVSSEQALYHLIVLSNTTPRRWIAEQEARFPHGICVITAPVEIAKLGRSLQQNQLVDYRLRRPAALEYLAQALAGEHAYVNPTLPENFSRSRGPYPLRLVGLGLRLLGAVNLIVGASALSIALLLTAHLPYPLAALSLALGVWCFWEAERSQMRRTTLAALLLTVVASLGSLGYWLFSGSLSALAPHGLLVQYGDINRRVNTTMVLAFILAGVPLAVFMGIALVEMLRNVVTLRRWLPGIAWPGWRRTLGVAASRNVNVSYGVYGIGIALAVMLLFADSPLHFPRFHEYELPDAGLHAQQLALAPNGNVWFETSGYTDAFDTEYHIGYITPARDLHANSYSIIEPTDCQNHIDTVSNPFDCIAGAGFRLGSDGSLWFATSQGSLDKTVFIVRITPDGRIHRFPMPEHTFIPRMQFTFDESGDLWYLRLTPLSLELEKDAIGRIDTVGHIEEFALPDNSNPVSLVSGPDGNIWATLADKAAIARITPDGLFTMFALPNGIQPIELLVGADRNLWFTAPKAATIGRITTDGVVSTIALPAHTNPHDLTVGADGAIWYVDTQHELQQEAIGRMTADGSVRTYQIAAIPTSGSTLVAAPDGSVWLTLYNTIGHITTDGDVTLYDAPTLDADLGPAILGTDHHLWFAEYSGVLGEFAT